MHLYFVGLDVHKQMIAYCVKTAAGEIVSEGKIAATRACLDEWINTLPGAWVGGMEAMQGLGHWRSGTFIVKPATVIGWHRKGFRLFWTWKIRRGKRGRPAVPKDVRDLIRTMSRENPLWGAPRIHGELLKPGISIGESRMNDSRGLRLTLPSSNRRCRFPTSGSPEDSRLRLAHGPIRTGAAHE